MGSLFFFYTLAFITLCLVTSVTSLMAFRTSHRRLFLLGGILFLAYAAEMSEIFFYEYTWQNVAFPAASYYEISHPLVRTSIAAVAQGCAWLMARETLGRWDDLRSPVSWGTTLAFFAVSLLVCAVVPEGPWRQWAYYTTRNVFLLGSLLYLGREARRMPEGRARDELLAKRRSLWVLLVLLLVVVAEDTLVILVIPETQVLEALYLSERNISENVLAGYFAILILRDAWRQLTVRIGEGPKTDDTDELSRAIAEQMGRFQEANGLTKRECEVLTLVLEGKSNQQIANELYLAVGTVKTHVHNIMKKSGQASRETLTLAFWNT